MTAEASPWICCQIGSREHYALPRALARKNLLQAFYTDAWVTPGSLASRLAPSRLRERCHADLLKHGVKAPTTGLLMRELYWRWRRTPGWPKIMLRNRWFQQSVIRQLQMKQSNAGRRILFSYSYAARDLFTFARARGWPCVLGQMDPAIVEEQIVAELYSRNSSKSHGWQKAPPEYWASWRQECELADVIIVNSEWSREALVRADVAPDKIVTVPLVYETPAEAAGFQRQYPETFSPERPLRLLFLGQVILRKGIEEIREAMSRLRGAPVELWVVGPGQGDWPQDTDDSIPVKHFGTVSRSETAKFYRDADLFLFPTHSDGFGLTQLEAQAWKLPIIASRNCGEVVSPGVNGVLLNNVKAESLAEAIRQLLRQPRQLAALSAGSRTNLDFGLDELAAQMQRVLAVQRPSLVQSLLAAAAGQIN